jgi:hypothetical protein
MPNVTPRGSAVGPLFCGEHPGVAATHVITSNGTALALCGACVTALADQLTTLRLHYGPTLRTRNSWPERVAADGR